MTYKQIIIDGVDVGGCNERSMCINCDTVTNCYYKQLKRKEEECDMWKNLTVDNGAVALKYQQQLDQLEAKNSILEDEYKILEDNLDSRTRDFEDVIDEYKQTLIEIKKIAEPYYTLGSKDSPVTQILNKISKVLDEERQI